MSSRAAVLTSFLGVCIFVSCKIPDSLHFYVSLQKNDHFFFGKDILLGEKETTDVFRCLQYCLSVDRCWSVNLGPIGLGFSSSKCQLFAWNERVNRHSLEKRRGFVFIKLYVSYYFAYFCILKLAALLQNCFVAKQKTKKQKNKKNSIERR